MILGFFSPPVSRSKFHELVNDDRIVPVDGLRGYYQLNASLKRLGLREVRKLPGEETARTLEDIARLAFTLIDPLLFPAPAWMLKADVIDGRDLDHARRIADQYREKVESYEHVQQKLAYFGGVLDALFLNETDRKSGGS